MKKLTKSMNREKLKSMRSLVMVIALKELGMDKDFFYEMLEKWGFGTSLRKLSAGELRSVIDLMRGKILPHELTFGIGTLDAQGRYMYNLMKQAGWDMLRLRKWWLKRMSASHWNALDDREKRSTIAMLKTYIENNKSKA